MTYWRTMAVIAVVLWISLDPWSFLLFLGCAVSGVIPAWGYSRLRSRWSVR